MCSDFLAENTSRAAALKTDLLMLKLRYFDLLYTVSQKSSHALLAVALTNMNRFG